MTTFEEGPERNKALGIWGAIAGSGGAAGVLLGGHPDPVLNWSWIFYINVPVGLAVITAAPRYLRESKVEGGTRASTCWGRSSRRRHVAAGVRAGADGRPLLVGAAHDRPVRRRAVLLAGFIVTERAGTAPLMPLHIFRNRSLSAANAVGLMLGASMFSMFFLLTLYMQQVLGYSPLETGVGYLLVAG